MAASFYAVYRDSGNQWRWRYVAKNGKIIAVSSESYIAKADCLHSINLIKGSGSDPVIDS